MIIIVEPEIAKEGKRKGEKREKSELGHRRGGGIRTGNGRNQES
jgi:hypothetical protein